MVNVFAESQGPRAKDQESRTKNQGRRHTHALNAIRSNAFAKLYWTCCRHVLTRRTLACFELLLIWIAHNSARASLHTPWSLWDKLCIGILSNLSWASLICSLRTRSIVSCIAICNHSCSVRLIQLLSFSMMLLVELPWRFPSLPWLLALPVPWLWLLLTQPSVFDLPRFCWGPR